MTMPEKDLLSENDFHALLAITDSDMLDDDEITSANVSMCQCWVDPSDEKDYQTRLVW